MVRFLVLRLRARDRCLHHWHTLGRLHSSALQGTIMLEGLKGFFCGYPVNDDFNALVFRWLGFVAVVIGIGVPMLMIATLT
jgi:hypothetical protein